jgi:hypothetical protein
MLNPSRPEEDPGKRRRAEIEMPLADSLWAPETGK